MKDALVEGLDSLRYTNAQRALTEAREGRVGAEPAQVVRLLGVSASCHRLLANVPAGKGCIALGLNIEESHRSRFLRGDLLQRVSHLVADEGRGELALELNKEALLEYAEDSSKIGRCLVDRGIFLFGLERISDAEEEFRRSLDLLDFQTDKRNAFSAQQNLAICLVEGRRLDEALVFGNRAAEFENAVGIYSQANLQWLLGDLKSVLTGYHAAILHYSKGLDLYLSVSLEGGKATKAAGQAALIGVRVVECQIHLGKIDEAHATSRELVRLAEPLNRNRVVTEALLSLAYTEKLTRNLVTGLKRRLELGLSGTAEIPWKFKKRRSGPCRQKEYKLDRDAYKLIERLDNLRYFEPLLALAEARRAMDEADPPQRALLLGVAASCHRLLANIPAGKGCISLGLKLVDNFYNCLIQGDLLQRLSYLVGDEARFELALAVNKEAFLSHAGDVRRLGQCCVDRGNFLFSLERFSEATMEFRRSMELLDIQEDKRNMFSAQQNLATCLVKEKELKEALKFASKAVKLEDAVGVYSRANLQWLLGDIKSELTEHLEAHTNYAKALELYLSLSFRGAATKAAGQGALVGMKLVGCQITLGRIKEATRTSKDLVKLATPLSGNAVVSSALLSLGYSQNLTEKLVTNLTLQVERGLGKIAQAQEVMLLSGR